MVTLINPLSLTLDASSEVVDLNTLFGAAPHTTFYMRMSGDAMTGAGIYSGDILVINRALDVSHGDIIVAAVGDSFVVREYVETPFGALISHNPDFPSIMLDSVSYWSVFGPVAGLVRARTRRPQRHNHSG